MKRILVPTDFSRNALKAAFYAAEIAQRSKAVIYLLYAIELGVEKIYGPFALHRKYDILVRENRASELAAFSKRISKKFPLVKVEMMLEDGEPVNSILDFCRYKKIDLVVMGTKGVGAVKQRLIGTVTAGVVGKSKVPVLVVPVKYELEKPDGILFLTNHFEKSKRKLNMIMTLATFFSAEVTVGLFLDVNDAEAIQYLEGNRKINEYLKFLKTNYPKIKFKGELIKGANFEGAVALYHARHNTDLAAMITYPKSFWEKVLLKSITKKMVFHSRTPVLAIPYK